MLSRTFVNLHLRYGTKPLMGALRDMRHVRAIADLYARTMFRVGRDMHFEDDLLTFEAGAVECLWCGAGAAREDKVILYLHGGGFTIGGYASHKAMVARIAGAAGLRAALVDYRRAPEAPYPGAIDDAHLAYCALIARGYAGGDVILAGDSAGAGLVYSLLLRLEREGLPKPAACVAISPWADLTMSGPSHTGNLKSEVMLAPGWIERSRRAYLNGGDGRDPDVSPVFGAFEAPPPSLIIYGEDEVLASDSVTLIARLRAAGGAVTVETQSGLPHVWTLYQGRFAPADATIAGIAGFIRSHCPEDAP